METTNPKTLLRQADRLIEKAKAKERFARELRPEEKRLAAKVAPLNRKLGRLRPSMSRASRTARKHRVDARAMRNAAREIKREAARAAADAEVC